jgi:hypothetical protein
MMGHPHGYSSQRNIFTRARRRSTAVRVLLITFYSGLIVAGVFTSFSFLSVTH